MGVWDLYRAARQRLHHFGLGQWEELTRLELVLLYPGWVIYLVVREFIKDRALVRANSLAYTTVLSVVPVLTVATTLLGAFGSSSNGVTAVLETMLPFETEVIVGHINQFVTSQAGAISGIGAVVLIVLGVALFNNIEHAFNDIWRVHQQRPLLNKFLTFYALITLAPLLITASIVQSARLQIVVDQVPLAASVGYKLLPVGLGWILFTIGNKLLPYTRVAWLPALISGLVTAIAFEGAKFGFNIYVTTFVFETYSKVYGAIGLIPIFLIWVYVCWVIVLFGAKLTYVIQNFRALLVPARVRRLADRKEREFAPLVALEVLFPIAVAFKRGEGPARLEQIAASAGVPLDLARSILSHLVDAKIVLEITREAHDDTELSESAGFLPARPLQDVPIIEVLYACRPEEELPHHAIIGTLRDLYAAREREVFEGMTCEALVSQTALERLRSLARALAADGPALTGARRRSDVFERIAVEADSVINRIRIELDHPRDSAAPPRAASAEEPASDEHLRETIEAELLTSAPDPAEPKH